MCSMRQWLSQLVFFRWANLPVADNFRSLIAEKRAAMLSSDPLTPPMKGGRLNAKLFVETRNILKDCTITADLKKDDGKRRPHRPLFAVRPVRCNLNPDRGSCGRFLFFVAVLPKSWPVRSCKGSK